MQTIPSTAQKELPKLAEEQPTSCDHQYEMARSPLDGPRIFTRRLSSFHDINFAKQTSVKGSKTFKPNESSIEFIDRCDAIELRCCPCPGHRLNRT